MPNRERQKSYVSTTTEWPPGTRSSSAVRPRPMVVPSPSASNHVPETSSASMRSLRPPYVRLSGVENRAATLSNTAVLSRKSRNIGYEKRFGPMTNPEFGPGLVK